jgi:hypothetical protein
VRVLEKIGRFLVREPVRKLRGFIFRSPCARHHHDEK